MFQKLLAILTFKDLSINKKFLFFVLGYLFWFLVVTITCIGGLFFVKYTTDLVIEEIIPWNRTSDIIIRKLRGLSVSVHKIVLYDEVELINKNYNNATKRIEQSKSYINSLLNGGEIRDISVALDEVYIVYPVKKITNQDYIKTIKICLENLVLLENLLNDIYVLKTKSENTQHNEIIKEKLLEFDNKTRETVNLLNIFSNSFIKLSDKYKNQIQDVLIFIIVFVLFCIVTGILLSIIFGYLMTKSIKNNIDMLSQQIKALSTGEIDLTKRLKVDSVDEIGNLCNEFNSLIDNIQYINGFKKIIEEDETIEDVYQRLGDVFTYELGLKSIIYEVSNSKNSMRIVYPQNMDINNMYCNKDILLNSNLCRSKRTGHMITTKDYDNICKYFSLLKDEVEHFCLPIMISGEVGGVVQFLCDPKEKCDIQAIEKKIGRAKQFINETQPVIEAKRLMLFLKQSAIKDSLTGLYNRRFLEESYITITSGILRRNTVLGILMCDIDYFKQVNDSYGHDIGDLVLKETAANILKSIRASDIAIRFGGEEFMVLLVDIKENESKNIAEKIRQRMENYQIKIPTGHLQKTISIGIAEFPIDAEQFWEAVKYADVALYKAKEAGRNRVVKFTKDMWQDKNY